MKPELRSTLATALVGVVLTTALLVTGAGDYLEERLAYVPALRVREALGARPSLDEDVRLVLADDGSMRELGRHPTLADWRAVHRHLEALGFESVIFHGFNALSSEIGDAGEDPSRVPLAVGAIAVDDDAKRGTYSAELIPRRMLLAPPARERDVTDDVPPFRSVLGPEPGSLGGLARMGALNILSDNTFPLLFIDPEGFILPNLAFYASPAARDGDGALRSEVLALARTEAREAYIDYVQPASVLARSVPLDAFFDKQAKTVKPTLSDALKKRLEGGRVAILVPSAYTGTRNIRSPLDGFVPAYVAFVSQVSGVLNGGFIHRPVAVAAIVVPFAFLWLLLVTRPSAKVALGVSAGVAALFIATGFAALMLRAWLLPVAQVTAVFAGLWLTRAAHQFVVTRVQKDRVERDLELGRLVQELFLPASLSGRLGDFDYELVFRPHGAMSGDWLQVFEKGDGSGVLAMGDVVGKGPSAAMITSVIASIWQRATSRWRSEPVDVDAFASQVATNVHATFKGNQYTTLALAHVDGAKVRLMACATPKWIHWPTHGEAKSLKTKSSDPLGMREQTKIARLDVDAQPGDVLIAFSDGVIDGSEPTLRFLERLKDLPREADDATLLARIAEIAVEAGEASAHPDDRSMILLRYRGAA